MKTVDDGALMADEVAHNRAVAIAKVGVFPLADDQEPAVVLEERWATGEWFRSGSVWNVGKGKVFYLRPGHETYDVYHNPTVLLVLENAARWLGEGR